jgi:hypothetical protein
MSRRSSGDPKTGEDMHLERRLPWFACVASLVVACGGTRSGSGPSTTGSQVASAGSSAGSEASGAGSGESGNLAAAGSAAAAGSVAAAGDADGGSASTGSSVEPQSGLDAAPDAVTAALDGGIEAANGAADAQAPFCNPGDAGDGTYTLGTTDPPEWKLAAGVTAGKLTPTASFLSTTFGLHFPYTVYTSTNYSAGHPAIFLVFGDGISTYLNGGFHAATVLDNLTASGAIPPTVALFVDPPSDGGDPATVRVATYDPPTDKYPTFLMTELIPQVITGKYSISDDPDAWALIGYSASGGQGWNDIWKLPDNFHKFIGNSASYGAANVAMYGNVDWVSIIASSPMRDIRASNTTCLNDLMDQRGSWLTIITNVYKALVAKGNHARIETGPNGHYPPVDGERDFPNSLRWMFQGCKFSSN